MPAKELDFTTIAAATAGLCLAAGAVAFFTSTPNSADGDAVSLAPTPSSLIFIEDDYEVILASIDTLDPMDYARAHGIIIEDDDEEFAFAATTRIDAPTRSRSLFAALSGSVGVVDMTPPAPASSAPARAPAPSFSAAPRPRMDLVRPSMAPRASSDERVASLDRTATSASSRRGGAAGAPPKASLVLRAVTPDQIQSAIEQQLPRVRACYERQLKAEEDLRGRMVLAMSVTASGSVSRARLKGDEIGSSELAACVVREVASFRFPAGTESLAVEYPVMFKPSF